MNTVINWEREISKTMNRMAQAQAYEVRQAMKAEGVTVNRGRYYEGGPICIQVMDAEGKQIASCKLDDLDKE